MNNPKRKQPVLGQISLDNNPAMSSNYNSITQVTSLHSKIESLETSLQLSLKNQKNLNQNLQFMLQNQKCLRKQLDEKDIKIKHLQKQFNVKNKQFDVLSQSIEAIKQLLEQSQSALEAANSKLTQKQSIITRNQSTIREQKKVVQQLENQKLYNNLNGFDNTVKEERNDQIYKLKQSYEKKVNQLEYKLKRSENSCLNEKSKSDKFEKQVNQFKRWLCKLVGIDKIVAGCEKMIMNEVTKRLSE